MTRNSEYSVVECYDVARKVLGNDNGMVKISPGMYAPTFTRVSAKRAHVSLMPFVFLGFLTRFSFASESRNAQYMNKTL